MVHGGGSRSSTSRSVSQASSPSSNRAARSAASPTNRAVSATTRPNHGGGSRRVATAVNTASSNRQATVSESSRTPNSSESISTARGASRQNEARELTKSTATRGSASQDSVTTRSNVGSMQSGGGTRPTASSTRRSRPYHMVPNERVSRSSRTAARSVVQFENPTPSNTASNSMQEPLLPVHRADDDNCRNCCCCCGALCLVAGCAAVTHQQAKKCWGWSLSLLTSLVLFGIMLLVSGYQETWMLHAGENRALVPNRLLRHVTIQADGNSIPVDVFAFSNHCPSLKGPMVKAYYELDMDLSSGDYQYDYFHLNRDSQVHVTMTQYDGATNVHLLQGQDKIDELTSHHSGSDYDEWLDDLLHRSKQTWMINTYQHQPRTAHFRAMNSDEFVLVYDNPFASRSSLSVDLTLELTTYDVTGYTPYCSDVAYNRCSRKIPVKKITCMIVDAHASTTSEVVQVQLQGYRNYGILIMLSILPLVLFACFRIYQSMMTCCKNDEPNEAEANNDEEQVAFVPPAPFAPHDVSVLTEPSAPVEQDMIPVAEVVQVATTEPPDSKTI